MSCHSSAPPKDSHRHLLLCQETGIQKWQTKTKPELLLILVLRPSRAYFKVLVFHYLCVTTHLPPRLVGLFDMQRGGAPATGDDADSGLTLHDLSRLLGGASGWSYAVNARNNGDDDDEDYVDEDHEDDYDEDDYGRTLSAPRSGHPLWYPPATEPQEAGVELLMGGEFGRVGPKIRSRQNDVNIARTLRNRAYNPRPIQYKEDVASVRSTVFQ